VRCQRMTVSGFTSRTASLKRRKRPANAPRSHRSKRRHRGRLTCRRTTISCWRRIRFSATRAARGATTGQDDVEEEAKEGDHGPERLLRQSIPGVGGRPWRVGGRVRGQVEDLRRDGHVTVGETGSGPAHVRSICAPQVVKPSSAW
jgi:hypothetical protein